MKDIPSPFFVNILMAATRKGIYDPIHRGKYIGNHFPTYRSAWERRVMYFLDNNEKVYRWGSELFPIAYMNPIDSKIHQYFPDFYVEIIKSDGDIQKLLVEVKPEKQTVPPVKGGKKAKTFAIEMQAWVINKAKWDSAIKYCSSVGLRFMVLTERNIGF